MKCIYKIRFELINEEHDKRISIFSDRLLVELIGWYTKINKWMIHENYIESMDIYCRDYENFWTIIFSYNDTVFTDSFPVDIKDIYDPGKRLDTPILIGDFSFRVKGELIESEN